jgi:RNA methyltransferase, TrmH family
MVAQVITSLQHPLVKKMVKLRESRQFRELEQTAVVTSLAVILELAPHCKIKTLISTRPYPIDAEHKETGSEAVLQKIVGHASPDLVAAEIYLPPPSDLKTSQFTVVLDGLGDPGNVGTVFRSALALGWDGIFVIKNTADPYNDKALRASKGAPFLIPWREGSWSDFKSWAGSKRQIVVADMQGIPLKKMQFIKPVVLVMGHETQGPSQEAKALGTAVTIPMHTMESLNVASAASIFLYTIHQELLS